MTRFDSNGIAIAYDDLGEGPPVLMIHGFGSSAAVNWLQQSWSDLLTGAGRRVVAFDHRGHGRSQKLYDPAAYRLEAMAGDALALLDHLAIRQADIVGYSMGSRVSVALALAAPDRVRSVVLGGIGTNLIHWGRDSTTIAEALEAPSIDDVSTDLGHMFRRFADQTKSDRRALAACMRGPRTPFSAEILRSIEVPVLVACGTKDEMVGDPKKLVAMFPNGRHLPIPDRDHMRAVGDRVFKRGVLAFLEEVDSA